MKTGTIVVATQAYYGLVIGETYRVTNSVGEGIFELEAISKPEGFQNNYFIYSDRNVEVFAPETGSYVRCIDPDGRFLVKDRVYRVMDQNVNIDNYIRVANFHNDDPKNSISIIGMRKYRFVPADKPSRFYPGDVVEYVDTEEQYQEEGSFHTITAADNRYVSVDKENPYPSVYNHRWSLVYSDVAAHVVETSYPFKKGMMAKCVLKPSCSRFERDGEYEVLNVDQVSDRINIKISETQTQWANIGYFKPVKETATPVPEMPPFPFVVGEYAECVITPGCSRFKEGDRLEVLDIDAEDGKINVQYPSGDREWVKVINFKPVPTGSSVIKPAPAPTPVMETGSLDHLKGMWVKVTAGGIALSEGTPYYVADVKDDHLKIVDDAGDEMLEYFDRFDTKNPLTSEDMKLIPGTVVVYGAGKISVTIKAAKPLSIDGHTKLVSVADGNINGHSVPWYHYQRGFNVVTEFDYNPQVGDIVAAIVGDGYPLVRGNLYQVTSVSKSKESMNLINLSTGSKDKLVHWNNNRSLALVRSHTEENPTIAVTSSPAFKGDTVIYTGAPFNNLIFAGVEYKVLDVDGEFATLVTKGRSIEVSVPRSFLMVVKQKSFSGNSWGINVNNADAIDMTEVRATVNRKNPVLVVDSASDNFNVVCVHNTLMSRMNHNSAATPDYLISKYEYENCVCFGVPNENTQEFVLFLKDENAKPFPSEGRRDVTITLVDMD